MDNVDAMRSEDVVDDSVNKLESLFQQHIKAMGLRTEGQREIARVPLLSAYVDAARSFQASRMGNIEDALKFKEKAEQTLSEMRDKLTKAFEAETTLS